MPEKRRTKPLKKARTRRFTDDSSGLKEDKRPYRRYVSRHALAIALVAVAIAVTVITLLSLVYAQTTRFDPLARRPFSLYVSDRARSQLWWYFDAAIKGKKEFKVVKTPGADIVVAEKPLSGYQATKIVVSPGLTLTAGNRTVRLAPERSFWFMSKKQGFLLEGNDPRADRLLGSIRDQLAARQVTKFNAVGDILPGRHVVQRMKKHGYDYPFKAIAPEVRGADVSYGDLECPLTDRVTPPTSGMLFSAPAKTIDGMKLLGLSVVGVANNHTTNFGVDPFVDTLKLLAANGISYCGGGNNYDQAHSPAVKGTKAMKFSFLDYDSIPDVIVAGSGPGVAWISLPPWGSVKPEEIATMQSDIRKAKSSSDYVIANYHWSKEDVYQPSPQMRDTAYKALDAGAGMVIGGHPHTIQPIEYHNGHLIFYSMGNFVFDQMQRDQTREGFFIKCTFLNKELTNVKLVPYKIRDYSQPVPLSGTAGQKLLNKVLKLSGM